MDQGINGVRLQNQWGQTRLIQVDPIDCLIDSPDPIDSPLIRIDSVPVFLFVTPCLRVCQNNSTTLPLTCSLTTHQ